MSAVGMHVGGYACLGELLRDALIQYKSELALIEANRRKEAGRWTYLEFWKRAEPLARRLQDLGIGAGDRVAIVMSNQSKWLVSAYAALYRGAVLVPLDYKLAPAEIEALLAHARPSAVVVEYPIWRRMTVDGNATTLVTESPDSADLRGAVRWEDQPAERPAPALVPRTREDIATIVYSSGTGGRPKGCMLSHGAYLSQSESLLTAFPMAPGDRYFSILPSNHAIDFMCGFVGSFCCGATVLHQRVLRPELIVSSMQRYRVTHMAVVPLVLTAFERAIRERIDGLSEWKRRALDGLIAVNGAMTERGPRPAISRTLLRPIHDAFGGALRLVFCGGAPVDRAQVEFFYQLGLPVVVGYGLTEACTVVTVNGVAPFRSDSVGAPVPGVEVRIAESNAEGVGEVLVRGPTLMTAYLDDPEQTATTLQDGWLHTGDLGYLDASHHLHLVGRCKDMIVTAGGKNVYPQDVEHAFEGLPCEEIAVFAANTVWPRRGLSDERLIGVVRPTNGIDAMWGELHARNRRLPDFKRLAGVVTWADPFPRTATMKVKRIALASAVGAATERDDVRAL